MWRAGVRAALVLALFVWHCVDVNALTAIPTSGPSRTPLMQYTVFPTPAPTHYKGCGSEGCDCQCIVWLVIFGLSLCSGSVFFCVMVMSYIFDRPGAPGAGCTSPARQRPVRALLKRRALAHPHAYLAAPYHPHDTAPQANACYAAADVVRLGGRSCACAYAAGVTAGLWLVGCRIVRIFRGTSSGVVTTTRSPSDTKVRGQSRPLRKRTASPASASPSRCLKSTPTPSSLRTLRMRAPWRRTALTRTIFTDGGSRRGAAQWQRQRLGLCLRERPPRALPLRTWLDAYRERRRRQRRRRPR